MKKKINYLMIETLYTDACILQEKATNAVSNKFRHKSTINLASRIN